jgi:transcriptional regulator with XRE-family HTH domain
MKIKEPLTDGLLEAMKASGLTRYEIAKRTGLDQGALSRFVHGKTVTLTTGDKLAVCLGLELRASRKAKPSRKGART